MSSGLCGGQEKLGAPSRSLATLQAPEIQTSGTFSKAFENISERLSAPKYERKKKPCKISITKCLTA